MRRRGLPLYRVWMGMRARCNNPAHIEYHNYGGRGIKVCEEWNDFLVFNTWGLENGYAPGLTIDRKKVNGNYCPKNCRWLTMREQCNNTRVNHFIEWRGKKLSIADWGRETGIDEGTILWRVSRGWPIDKALTKISQKVRHD